MTRGRSREGKNGEFTKPSKNDRPALLKKLRLAMDISDEHYSVTI